MSRTKTLIKPEIKVERAFVKNANLKQYKMPNETGLSYRTVLRTLKPLESRGFIKLVKIEPSSKGGKENKIYALTLKGVFSCLNSFTPEQCDFEVNGGFHYSLDKANEVIKSKIKPYNLNDIINFLKVSGTDLDFPIFREIHWLHEHFREDIFRAIMNAASQAIARDKLPNVDGVRNIMINQENKSPEETEVTIKEFLNIETLTLRDIFTEAFAFQLSFLQGKGDLHNESIQRIFAKVAAEIEQRNQSTLYPLKQLVETLK